VIGTRGNKGLGRFVLGSTAELLIHHAICPVLTVGPEVKVPEKIFPFERIVYATDFSPESTKAFPFALSFAEDSGARIYLCHVSPSHDEAHGADGRELMDNFNETLKRLVPSTAQEWCEPECIIEHGYAADGILLLARRVNADLIVLGTRKVSHWFLDVKAGIAFEVIRAANCPVLTVRG
jgi:nucleotide-binding universal stress UspA family protein